LIIRPDIAKKLRKLNGVNLDFQIKKFNPVAKPKVSATGAPFLVPNVK